MRPVWRRGTDGALVAVNPTVWDIAVKAPHQVFTRVDVLLGGEVVAEDLPVIDGTVTHDRRAAVLARCEVSFAPDGAVTLPVSDGELSPFGFELRIARGVRVVDSSGPLEVFVFLGIFPIQRSTVNGVTLLSNVSAMDRSRRVQEARFEDDYSVAAGVNYATAIQILISDGVSGLEFAFPSTTATTPLLTFDAQSDRWAAAQGMARALGNELFFDGLGRCVMRPEPSVTTAAPDIELVEGVDGVLTDLDVELDRQPAYNRVIATSSNAALDDVFRGVATDNDPSSPTYYFGTFGKKPRFYASPFIASDIQAQSAAQAILDSGLGIARSLSVGFSPNARFEPGDAGLVRRDKLEVNEVQLSDEVQLSLGPEGVMTSRTRARQESVA